MTSKRVLAARRKVARAEMRERVVAGMSKLICEWPSKFGPEGHAVMTAVLNVLSALPTGDKD